MANKANIINGNVAIFLAPSGADLGNLQDWLEVGWCEAKKTRLSVERIFQKMMNRITLIMGKELLFSATGLETDRAKLLLLEALQNVRIDIRLISRENPLLEYLLSGFKLDVGPQFVYTRLEPNRFILRARRKIKNGVFGLGIFSQTELVGLENWGVVNVS